MHPVVQGPERQRRVVGAGDRLERLDGGGLQVLLGLLLGQPGLERVEAGEDVVEVAS